MHYGGNTPCVEIVCGDKVLIFDAGTGMRALGEDLIARGVNDADLYLSHTHYDHILGLPFCWFAHTPGNTLRIWAGHLEGGQTIEQTLRNYMKEPLFPVTLDIFVSTISCHDFKAGDDLTPGPGIAIRTALLNHPNGATGYRVDYGGKSICYLTDTEHTAGALDQNILGLIQDADIVIYDATFTDEEYQRYAGWGHSTWQEGVRLCQAAGAKTLAIFHHLPERTDTDLAEIEAEAKQAFPGALVAREGLTLTP